MSKDTNKQAAEKLFASTTHNVLWSNPKGEFFTSENIGALSLQAGQKLEKHERPQEKEATAEVTTVKPKSADALIAEIKNIATIEMAELGKDVEAKGKNRTTVIAAYNERIEQLTAALTVEGAKTETGATEGATGTQDGNEDTGGQK